MQKLEELTLLKETFSLIEKHMGHRAVTGEQFKHFTNAALDICRAMNYDVDAYLEGVK